MTAGREAGIRVDGLAPLRRDLKRVAGDLADLKAANARAIDTVIAEAGRNVPRRSGALAASLRGSKGANRATVLAGGARLPYAGPVHWGWPARNIEPQPFVVDAAHDTEPEWLGAYQDEINDALDRVNGHTY